jgi:hypothetical protein
MKISVYAAWLIVALMVSGSREASGQATKEPAKPAPERPKTATNTTAEVEAQFFQFGGGNFDQFMDKLKERYGKEVYDLIEIREAADTHRIHVPKMRIRASSVSDVRDVLFTYNRISQEGDGFLGKWIFSPREIYSAGNRTSVETIIFLTPKGGGADGTGGIQVRAFSVRWLSEERRGALAEIIEKESRRLQDEIRSRAGDISAAQGRVSVHSSTGLLMASGGKTYVELVGTLYEAFLTNLEKLGPAMHR